MARFLFKISLFITIGILLGEGIVRVFQLSIDVPKMYQGSDNLIKFEPNQTGNYIHGEHRWVINKYGHYGYEPPSLDSLITVVGDSYISNVMNPPNCHQTNFLANLNEEFNFYPTSRDGASFIEFMEMKESLQDLNPVSNLFYVHHGDFIESIVELERKPLTVQVSLENEMIRYAKLTSSSLKSLLYNFKFGYYIYRNFLVTAINDDISTNNRDEEQKTIDYSAIESLLDYTKTNYRTEDIILVFSPDSDKKVVQIAEEKGFETIELNAPDYDSWQLENDSHWSCTGHRNAALQVNKYLNTVISPQSRVTSIAK